MVDVSRTGTRGMSPYAHHAASLASLTLVQSLRRAWDWGCGPDGGEKDADLGDEELSGIGIRSPSFVILALL